VSIVVEATYEKGVLKLERPLPLDEHEKVRVTVDIPQRWAERTYGLLRWTGDPETLRRVAEDPEFGIREAR
jgi:predicted DNA-binding antitoxin AbrB/MazE fold protein